MKRILSSLQIAFLIILPSLSIKAQTSFLDDFNDNTLSGWGTSSSYTLTESGGVVQLNAHISNNKWQGIYNNLDGVTTVDISANPYVSLKIKALDKPCVMSMYIFDASNNKALSQRVLVSDDLVTYVWDFGPDHGSVDLTQVEAIQITCNGNSMGFTGSFEIDDLALGGTAPALASIGGTGNKTYYKNTGSKSIVFEDISNAGSITFTGAAGIIENINVPAISNGMCEVTFDLVTDATGTGTATVTALGSGLYGNNSFNIDITIEDNNTPVLDQSSDYEMAHDSTKIITITGISDNNITLEQTINVTAVSDNQSVIADGDIVVDYTSDSPNADISVTASNAGTANITVTISDDGGGANSTTMNFAVDVFQSINNPPFFNPIPDQRAYNSSGQKIVQIQGISDGDNWTQNVNISGVSSDDAIAEVDSVSYSSGNDFCLLYYTPKSNGTVTVSVTATDDGGNVNNNGNQSFDETFDITVTTAPITGKAYEYDTDGNNEGWGGWGNGTMTTAGGVMTYDVDKSKWGPFGTGVNPHLDMTNDPYITVRARADENVELAIWLRSGSVLASQNPVRMNIGTTWSTFIFDYTSPESRTSGSGDTVTINDVNLLHCLINPGSAYNSGNVYFDYIRLGDQSDRPIPDVQIDGIAEQAVFEGADEKTIEITGIFDGDVNDDEVTLTATSDNASLIPDPTVTDVLNKTAFLTYTPAASGTGTATITVNATANNSNPTSITFNINVLEENAGTATTIDIDYTTTYQTIEGFGAFGYNKFFLDDYYDDLGASAIRIGFIGNQLEIENDNNDPDNLDRSNLNYNVFDWDILRELNENGVEKFILTSWSPPGWMKENLSESYGYASAINWNSTDNKMRPLYYDEFAEMAVAAVRLLKEESGIDLYGFGPQNEPAFCEPYASAILDPEHFVDVIEKVGQRFNNEGINTRLFMPEQVFSQGFYPMRDYIDSVQAHPLANEYTYAIATHGYASDGIGEGAASQQQWVDMYNNSQEGSYPKKMWMSETSGGNNNWNDFINAGGAIHGALKYGNVSLWTYWSFHAGSNSEGYCLIAGNEKTPRFYAAKQFYKFIRPGAVRIESTQPHDSILTVAFLNNAANDSNSVVVLINKDNVPHVVDVNVTGGTAPGKYEVYQTLAYQGCKRMEPIELVNDLVTLPPMSISTFVSVTNLEPSIDPVPDKEIFENSGTTNINLTGIDDGESMAQGVTITATSNNPALLPNPVVNYTSGSTGTLECTPEAFKRGNATITVTIIDGGTPAKSVSEQFIITVLPVNDEPAIDPLSNVNILEDAGPQTVNLTGIDDGDPEVTQTLSVVRTGGNASLISTPVVNYTSPNSTGTITFTPVADANGSVMLTVTVSDDGGTANGGNDNVVETFSVNIAAVNDEPDINVIANQNATTGQLKSVNMGGIADGDPELPQTINILASSSNTGIVPHPTVNYTSGNSTGTLQFTPNSAGSATITVTVSDDGGTANGGDNTRVITFDVNVADPVNLNPTIDPISDVNIYEDDAGETVNLSGISDGNGWIHDVTVTATSSNTGLIPDPTVTYTSGNSTGQLSFVSVSNQNGTATITVTVTDGGSPGLSEITTFDVNVTAVNDAPVIDAVSDPAAILENAGQQTINLTGIGDGDQGTQNINISASSGNTTLIPTVNVNYSSGSTGTLTYTPAAWESGSAVITVTLQDNGGIANGGVNTEVITFTVDVTNINNTPAIDPITDPIAVLEDASTQTVNFSGVSDGGDGGQTLTVMAVETTSPSNLLTNINVNYTSPGATGNITYDLLPGAHGTATIEVTLQDNGGTANGAVDQVTESFDVVITPVNDQPSINTVSDLNINEDAGLQTVNLSGIGDNDGGTQTVDVAVAGGGGSLITTPLLSYTSGNSTGSVTFTPLADANGSTTITVTVSDDGGTANGGIDTRVITFDVNVAAVNDEPGMNAISNQSLLPAQVKTVNLSGITDNDDDETQSLIVTASSSNTSVVNHPVVTYTSDDPTGQLEITGGSIGSATITVTLQDGGGTANGGDDTYQTTFDVNVSSTGNNNPTIDPVSDEIYLEDAGTQTVSLSGISDGDGGIQTVTISATSSDVSLIPDPTVSYTNGNAAGSLSLTPVSNQNGNVVITVTVGDDLGAEEIVQFNVDVTSVNDAPEIDAIADPAPIIENAGQQTINLSGIADGDEGTQGITITASSGNTALIPSVNVNYSSGASGSLTYTPAPQESGSALITVSVLDDGGTANGGINTTTISFTINVTDINNTPTADPVVNPSPVDEDASGPHSVSITGISDGGDGGQTIYLSAIETTGAGNLLTNLNVNYTSPNNSATVTYDLLPGANGTATVEITISDDGGTANGADDDVVLTFDVEITSVNDEPTIDPVALQTCNEDAGLQTINLTGIGDGDDGSQTLNISTSGGDLLLISNPVVNYTSGNNTGTITFTPVANANGSTTISVTLSDNGGTANGGDDEVSISIDIQVDAVNDAPEISAIPNQAASEGSLKTINLSGISDGDGWSQNVSITATSSDLGVSPHPTVTYSSGNSDGTLTFTPTATGSFTGTVVVTDDGGTANGGIDTKTITFDVTVNNAPNNNPTIDPVSDININEDAGPQSINLTGISDGDGWVQTVTITASSNNTGLVPTPTVVYTSGESTGSLNYTPADDASGTAQITLTLDDNLGAQEFMQFNINVASVNDAPVIDPVPDPAAIDEDTGEQSIALTGIGDGDDGLQGITLTATSSDTNIVSNVTVDYVSGATGNLHYTPVPDASGTATVSIIISDDGGTANGGVNETTETFVVEITEINDAPTADDISNPADLMEDDAQTVSFEITGISDGGEGNQSITITAKEVGNSAKKLDNLHVDYTSPASTATISYQLLPDAPGEATVRILISDDGGTANGGMDTLELWFLQYIDSINDSPSCDPIPDITNAEKGETITIDLVNLSDGDPDIVQEINVEIIPDDTLLILGHGYSSVSDQVYFILADDRTGTSEITLVISDDGGMENNGVDSLVVTFSITVVEEQDTTINIVSHAKPLIDLYPNPAHKQVTIKTNVEHFNQLIMVDAAGRRVMTKNIENHNKIIMLDISHLSRGNYHVIMQNNNIQHVKLLLIE